jgi:hypothetical protein
MPLAYVGSWTILLRCNSRINLASQLERIIKTVRALWATISNRKTETEYLITSGHTQLISSKGKIATIM